MAVIDLNQFAGERPQVHKSKLPPYQAETAVNTRLFSGALAPMRGPTQEYGLSQPAATIFKYRDGAGGPVWFEWPTVVDVARSPIKSDPYGRVFWAGDGYPKVTDSSRATGAGGPYPEASLQLGVPAPAAPSAQVEGTPNDPADLASSWSYVVTYVNSYGEEGPNSAPSQVVDARPGQRVRVTLPGPITGPYDLVTQRIYRSEGVGASAVFQFVADVDIAATEWIDTGVRPEEQLMSAEWDPPPDDLQGLISMPGGFFVGWRNNEILPSEVGLPHAYPVRYRQALDAKIVALSLFGNTIVALTDERPVVITGSHPGALVITRTTVWQGCTSREGVVSMGYGVVYPSPDGLVLMSPSGAEVITEGVIYRDQWQKLDPSSIKAVMWNGLYLAHYGGGAGAFLFNPRQPEAGMVFLDPIALAPQGGYYDAEDDVTYISANGWIYSFDTGSDLNYVWRSGLKQFGARTSMRVVRVLADSYPVTVRLYGDGELLASTTVGSDSPRRLVRPKSAQKYQVEVEAATTVYRVTYATTVDELQEVA